VREVVRAVASHMPVIVATGRMYRSALYWAEELLVQERWSATRARWSVRCHGRTALRARRSSSNRCAPVPARRALHIAREQDWHYQAYQHDELLCERDRPEARLYSHISGVQFRVVPDLEPLLEHGTDKSGVRHRGSRRGGSRHRLDDPGARR